MNIDCTNMPQCPEKGRPVTLLVGPFRGIGCVVRARLLNLIRCISYHSDLLFPEGASLRFHSFTLKLHI